MIIEGKHAEVGHGIFISDIQEGSIADQVRQIYMYYLVEFCIASSWRSCGTIITYTEFCVYFVKIVSDSPPSSSLQTVCQNASLGWDFLRMKLLQIILSILNYGTAVDKKCKEKKMFFLETFQLGGLPIACCRIELFLVPFPNLNPRWFCRQINSSWLVSRARPVPDGDSPDFALPLAAGNLLKFDRQL